MFNLFFPRVSLYPPTLTQSVPFKLRLQASRHNERQLASELQTIKTDFVPYNGSQKEL